MAFIGQISQKAKKIIKHLRQGTLSDAINDKYKQWRRSYIANKWNKIKAKKSIYTYRLSKNVKINLYPDDILSELIFKEGFELNEQIFLNKYLRPGDIFVDIGANIGLFTFIGAYAVGKTGQVFAFEPSALTYERLLQNMKLNKFNNVRCIQMAISDTTEPRTLNTSLDGYGAWNSFAKPTAGALFDHEKVKCMTLDKFITENDLIGKITLIKLDIEGWELHALKGGMKILFRSDAPNLLVEFTEDNAKSAGTTCAAAYNLLINLGYTLYSVDAVNSTLQPESLRDSYPYINLLATKHIDFVSRRVAYTVKQQNKL